MEAFTKIQLFETNTRVHIHVHSGAFSESWYSKHPEKEGVNFD